MYNFKIIDNGNELENICAAYGLCSILEDNAIPYILTNKKAYYNIETEEFNLDELEYFDIIPKDVWNVVPFILPKYKDDTIIKLNSFIKDNMEDILTFYLTGKSNKKLKSIGFTAIGNIHYTKGVRGGIKPTQLTSNDIKDIYNYYLGIIGWIKGMTYVEIKDISFIFMILKPKRITSVKMPYGRTYTDKETGEVKRATKENKKDGTALSVEMAIYLDTILNYNLIGHKYSDIITAKMIPPSTSPMQDKTDKVKIHNPSSTLCQTFLNILRWSIYGVDTKNKLALVIKNIGIYKYLEEFIWDFSCNKYVPIENKNNIMEELINMYNEEVKRIYNNETIKKVGRGLSYLMYKTKDKHGNKAISKLRNTTNEFKLQEALFTLIEEYQKGMKKSFLSENELNEIINLPNDRKEAKMVATAIMCYAKVFREPNKEQVVEEVTEEITDGRKTY